MDTTDSQLSDWIRDGKVCDSQDSGGNRTVDLSQNTLQNIIDGNFTPIMSQNSEDILAKKINESPTLAAILDDILHTEKTGKSDKEDDSCSSASLYFSSAYRMEQKKRTQKILEKSDSIKLDQVFDHGMTHTVDLDVPRDDVDGLEGSSLLNDTIDSFTTLSQVQYGSQTFPYLRKRTPAEQEQRDKKKAMEKISKNASEEARFKREANDLMSERMTQRDTLFDYDMDYEPAVPYRNCNIDAVAEIEEEETKPLVYGGTATDQHLDVSVIQGKACKKSDFAYINLDGKKILWTKAKCKVPVVVNWKIHPSYTNRKLELHVRLVSYLHKYEIGNAIRNPATDVLKCVNHTNEETNAPPESFFYVKNSTLPWLCVAANPNYPKGFHFFTKLEMGTSEVGFDVIFMCQKNCMAIEDKRKTMCLAVFLEDENGNELMYSILEEVNVCGYPLRDCKNYRSKHEFHFPENSSFRTPKSVTPSVTIDRESVPSSSRYQEIQKPFEKMFNLSYSSQMLPSMSNPRKRLANEHVQIQDPMRSQSKSVDYAMRLHGCGSTGERMDYKFDLNENKNQQSSSAKRSRPACFPYKNLQLSEEEYHKVVKFLADDAKETQNKWNSFVKYPDVPRPHLSPTDSVDRFLHHVGLPHHVDLFKRYGILSMADLTKEFKNNNNLFEKVVSDSSILKRCYDVFLNYYRIQEYTALVNEFP